MDVASQEPSQEKPHPTPSKRRGNSKPSHVFSKAENSKGGKQPKTLQGITMREKCNQSCPVFDRCPHMALSCGPLKTDESSGQPFGGGKCFVHAMPPGIRAKIARNMLNMLNGSTTGIDEEIRQATMDLFTASNKEGTFKAKVQYVRTLKDVKEALHGKVVKQEMSGSIQTGITVEDFKRAFDARKTGQEGNDAKS